MTEFRLPNIGENVETAEVLRVLVVEGDRVEKDQPIVELDSEKATVDVPSPFGGRVVKVHVGPGETIRVGDVIVTFEPDREVVEGGARATPARQEESPEEALFAAPSVRRIARDLGVDLSRVRGSGPAGRVSVDDVKAHVGSEAVGQGAGGPRAAGRTELPDFARFGDVSRERLSPGRRTIAERMARSWAVIPHVTLHMDADVTDLHELRSRYRERVEKAEGKLTLTAFLLKIAGSALRVFSRMNASLDDERQELVLKRYVHVAFAVDTERGLVAPVIRDVPSKSVVDLAVELSRVADRARAGKLGRGDLEGACFTVTNLGGMGAKSFTPIVNWPEVGILGLGRAEWGRKPEAPEEARLWMPLSLSIDHRVLDGADGARFLQWIARAAREPFMLAFEA